MNVYYIYRMTYDTGNAPCVTDINGNKTGILSLACCKGGQIRHYADGRTAYVNTGLRKTVGENFISEKKKKVGEKQFVIGIKGNRVIYLAEITEVLEMKGYFDNCKYQNRRDCIYEPAENRNPGNEGFESSLKRRKDFNKYFHGDSTECGCDRQAKEQHIRDELGKYVLLSDNFSYFGGDKERIISSAIMRYMPKRQETKTYRSGIDGYEEISDCFDKFIKQKFVSDTSTDNLDRNNCASKGCQK